jgi:hypothetical protein
LMRIQIAKTLIAMPSVPRSAAPRLIRIAVSPGGGRTASATA